ncbi:MAG: peptidoglycan -binding protein [Xanthobacteraceae bacterium]|jgi:chemotaxis protein MotB
MALSRARRDSGMNYWPGFVDALSTLVLSVIFLLTVFMVAQFFLSQDLAGKDTALQRLNAQISRLSQLLSLEQTGKASLEDQVSQLRASLNGAEGERDRLRDAPGAAAPAPSTGPGEVDSLNSQIDVQKEATARALAQIQNLNEQIRALRNQIAALQEALGTSDQKGKDAQVQIADLGQRLNVALAQRVQELSRYRSDFFGKLREILGNRPDIRVVGDRFVFQSELFFDSGNATLRPEGTAELDKIASALLDLQKQIPPEINWVLRVDGHTDTRQLGATSQFKSNWELSSARAISVVQYLISKGVPPQRLVAAGFGEFQPIDSGTTDEAFSHNRRIELKLTER